MLNRLLFEKGTYTQEVRYLVDLVEQRLLHPEKGDNGFLEELFDGEDGDRDHGDRDPHNDCFKFPNEFTKERMKAVVDNNYQDSYANLALIEIALYDHGQLKYRNHHKAFVKALVAWGILKVENDYELKAMIDSTKDKYSRLPKTGGYLSWDPRFQNEINICISIAEELGDTMPYRYKKTY